MTEHESIEALQSRRDQLIAQYDAATTEAEKSRLEAEIRAIRAKLNRISLDEGKAAGTRVDAALGRLRDVEQGEGQDAVSSLTRAARGVGATGRKRDR
jgi:hypothetical protein